jgi:hypothetical protein
LAHLFEHDAMVGGVEGSFEFRIHDIDIFVTYISASSIIMMMDARASCMLRRRHKWSCL